MMIDRDKEPLHGYKLPAEILNTCSHVTRSDFPETHTQWTPMGFGSWLDGKLRSTATRDSTRLD